MGPNGETVGIVPTDQALKLAQEADLDLVEIAPQGPPPVCKLMDYGKFKYENAQKAREARRNQTNVIIKEMKLRPKIDAHDYETKKGHVVRFLKAGDKVKITIMFRGREQHRPELGFRLLQKLAEDVTELGFVESAPKQDGRNMIMVLGPHKKKAEAKVEAQAAKEERAAERAAEVAEERAERTAAQRRPPGGPEEGARPLREPGSGDRGLTTSGLDRETRPSPAKPRHCDALAARTTYEERHMPKNKTALGCQEALPGDRVGQDPAPEGRPAPQPGEEALEGDPPAVRHHRGRQGRRQARQEAARSLSLTAETPTRVTESLSKEH